MNIDNKNTIFIKNLLIYFGGIFFNLLSLLFLNNDYHLIVFLIIAINLLPIFPLDGYSILKTIIEFFIPYKISLFIINFISILSILVVFAFLITKLDYLLFYNLLFILIMNIKNFKNISNNYQLFILNRYLAPPNYNFKRVKFKHNNYEYLYRYHKIKTNIGEKWIFENDILDMKYRL